MKVNTSYHGKICKKNAEFLVESQLLILAFGSNVNIYSTEQSPKLITCLSDSDSIITNFQVK